ncbi:uncharacterized protein CELE_T05C7.7 [Caenorhabditis elegans]|uniref:Uncharacterized protein n=1 Tax=Caenorhabditis elegans TaxID=6239 RepID=U4PCA0_CAEEL|nr:Uncharacterized protein CELE_T05C7.7 [Caenorhabditis elegans]CDH93489.1 Uncharacterized protein CELE_T05C7.7 [Caenorhabditis elegans]|eukprot:NP_001294655.1 Uncharacterized protein CELE_T05C7.7 [Caenorhabditis elegans]
MENSGPGDETRKRMRLELQKEICGKTFQVSFSFNLKIF